MIGANPGAYESARVEMLADRAEVVLTGLRLRPAEARDLAAYLIELAKLGEHHEASAAIGGA